jgi:hypothetical protein
MQPLQIALELEAGGLNKLLILGIVRDGGQLAADVGSSNPSQIDVKNRRLRKQPRGSGGHACADEQGDCRCNQHNRQKVGGVVSNAWKANRFRAL